MKQREPSQEELQNFKEWFSAKMDEETQKFTDKLDELSRELEAINSATKLITISDNNPKKPNQ